MLRTFCRIGPFPCNTFHVHQGDIMRTLFLWLVASIACVTTLLIASTHLVTERALRDPADYYTTLAAVLAVILGTGASVAGAVATVRLADLGLRISQRQALREAKDFTEARVNEQIEIFSALAIAISR